MTGGLREVGSRGRLNRFANALQYALCLESPSEGGRNLVARLALAKSMDHKKGETKARKMAQKCQRRRKADEIGESGAKKGKENTLCKFCVLTTNPKTQLASKNRHTRALN